MRKEALLMVLCLAFVGCNATTSGATKHSERPVILPAAHVDAESGNLIALWLQRPAAADRKALLTPVLVSDRYATYISLPNPEYLKDAARQRVFIFYDNVEKKCWQTRDFNAFLQIIDRQPKGIEVVRLDTCTVPRCYMPDGEWKRLEATMESRGIRWAKDPETEEPKIQRICYCESLSEFVYPGDRPAR